MTNLEERVRSGLHEAAGRIPETGIGLTGRPAKHTHAKGLWMGVAAVFTVLLLFSPLLFLGGTEPADRAGETPASSDVLPDTDVRHAEVGFEFSNPEHVRLQFSQNLTLTCQGLETVDNGGFDSFDMDIWIDHQAGYTRLGVDYPDGSEYDLILKGRPGAWEHAWGNGTDRGRSAGCRESLGDDAYDQSVAGWAYLDASGMWFAAYLKPVSPNDGAVFINHEGGLTDATAVAAGTYVIESGAGGVQISHEFTLDDAEVRVVKEQRFIQVPDQFEASAIIEVVESGPAPLPADIFDTSTFTPLWGNGTVVTTEGTTP